MEGRVRVRRDGDQPRACLSLAHSRIELVPPAIFVVPRGLGIEFLIHVPPHELSGLFLLRAAGVAYSEMRERRPGERGFRARSSATASPSGGDPDPDLAMVATDPGSWRSRTVCVSGMVRTA